MPTYDVWLARDSLASLRSPPTSIMDGQPADCVLVCCLRAAGVSRLTVHLPVDVATAQRFARMCRLEAMWDRRGLPSVFVATGLGLLPGVIGVVRDDLSLLLLAGLVELCLGVATLVGRSTLTLQRSRHHPVLAGRHHVLVRGVNEATALAWADLNPPGAVELRPRGWRR